MKPSGGMMGNWATPIVELQYGNELQNEIDSAFDKVKFIETPVEWGKTHKISNGFDGDVIGDLGLTLIADEIDKNIIECCQRLNTMFTTYKRTSWFTLFEKNDYGNVHDHAHATFSGCYYYKTSGKDGNIFFLCPVPAMNAHPGYGALANAQAIEAKVGKMLIFPGWLQHGIQRNTTDEPRISLSFNIEFDYYGVRNR